jgi:hypothetical protein
MWNFAQKNLAGWIYGINYQIWPPKDTIFSYQIYSHQLEGCGSLCFLTFWGKITKKLCVHSNFFCGEISKKFCVPSNFYMGEIMKKLCVPSNLFLGEIRQKLNCVPSFPCLCWGPISTIIRRVLNCHSPMDMTDYPTMFTMTPARSWFFFILMQHMASQLTRADPGFVTRIATVKLPRDFGPTIFICWFNTILDLTLHYKCCCSARSRSNGNSRNSKLSHSRNQYCGGPVNSRLILYMTRINAWGS